VACLSYSVSAYTAGHNLHVFHINPKCGGLKQVFLSAVFGGPRPAQRPDYTRMLSSFCDSFRQFCPEGLITLNVPQTA